MSVRLTALAVLLPILLLGACDGDGEVCVEATPGASPAAGEPGSRAVAQDDPAIAGWATGFVEPVLYGEAVDSEWQTPERALGPALGTAEDVISLGRGGSITLTFDPPIRDGAGADFAVFENGVNDQFLELAVVAVSSDGDHFETLPHFYLGEKPVSAYGGHEPTLIAGLAGAFRAGFGTPFDLATLPCDSPVDREAVRFVRVTDVFGDGSTLDSAGHPIYDPTPTVGSAGFDLEAIAVLHQAD